MNKFDDLQVELLYHKYRYYELNDPVITDYEYDMIEKECKRLSMKFFRYSEVSVFVHNMVGFDNRHPFWELTRRKHDIR